MITALYYAALKNNQFMLNAPYDIFGKQLNNDKIKDGAPVFNYANFFGDGINLYDNTVEFGDDTDHYGYLTNGAELVAMLMNETTIADLKNGITVIFDKADTCAGIEVWQTSMTDEGNWSKDALIGSYYNDQGVPLATHIPLTPTSEENTELLICLYPMPLQTSYVTLKGIVLGKILEIEDFFSFNSIAELRPIGDDLPLNEINSNVLLEEKFIDEEEQSIKYFDGELLEDGMLVSVENSEANKYALKSRNMIDLVGKGEELYNRFFESQYTDWNEQTITAEDALKSLSESTGLEFSYPEYFATYKLSPYLPPCSGRKLLQQIAWATCCGIDTSYKDKITFVPFVDVEPGIQITNADGRILKSSVKKGEKYSTIIWERTEYLKNEQIEAIGDIEAEYIGFEGDFGSYGGTLNSDTPFIIDHYKKEINNGGEKEYIINGFSSETVNPFSQYALFENEGTYTGYGHKYTAYKSKEIISTGIKKGKTLTISNQTVFPIDRAAKKEQLRRWYSTNNTLSAVVVDYGDIRLGRVISLQLEDDSFFTGVITKLERSNISDYHTVTLEAHEWH